MKSKLFAIILGFCCLSYTCGAFAATANGSFSYDFTTDVACSATVVTDCVDHFEIWDVTSTPKKIATISSSGVSPVTFSFKIGAPYGARKWSAVAVTKDGTSSDMQSSSSQAIVNVRPGAPASFVINLQ